MIRVRPETSAAWDAIEADVARIRTTISGMTTPEALARSAQMLQRVSRNANSAVMLFRGEIAAAKARDRADRDQRRTA